MTVTPVGLLDEAELRDSGRWIAARQHHSGLICWFDGGHTDPWNHVEAAMALDVAGRHDAAALAYRWLRDTQLPNGGWHNYYRIEDGAAAVTDAKFDSNTIAYVATGLWHHWLATGDETFMAEMAPMLDAALDFVLDLQMPGGEVIWARHADGTAWHYALLTASSSVCLSLRCGFAIGALMGEPRPDVELAAVRLAEAIRERPGSFEPRTRWAMDWYYPVLSGALGESAARARLESERDRFVMDGLGVRCVADEPWVTAAETAECAIAHAVHGDRSTAAALLATTRRHRLADGSYLTGIVHPDGSTFPTGERSSYTAAAVILANDVLGDGTATSTLWHGVGLPPLIA